MSAGLVATAIARPGRRAPLSLALAPATLTAVIGPNGAGKTRLLKALAGVDHGPGDVRIDGEAVAARAPAARVSRLAWLPADRDIAWPMRAADVVQLGLGPGARRNPGAVAAALALADAGAFADRRIDTLSTGERARVLLARALVARPAWLLLDEPVANLDPWHRLAVIDLLRRLADGGTGVVVALHDLDLARRADRLLLLDKGRLVADGPPAEALDAAALARVFRIRAGAAGWEAAAPAGS